MIELAHLERACLALALALAPGCYVFEATPKYSEDESFGPERFPSLALLVEDVSRMPSAGAKESVQQEFEATLLAKGYSLASRGAELERLLSEQATQLSDLSAGQVIELGKLGNAHAMVMVKILEFRTDALAEQEADEHGRTRPVTRYTTAAKLEAALFDVETGRKLWTAKFEAREDNPARDRRPDSRVLDRVAHAVAATCSPRPWWWFLWH
ncbi:MAG: hypothetical protein U1E76_27850 [Planctomycetota bacterium]